MTSVPINPECRVCTHPRSTEVDALLAGGTSLRDIERDTGLSRSSLGRHKLRHTTLEGVREELSEQDGGRLRVVEVHGRLSALAERLEVLVATVSRQPSRATSLANLSRELRMTLEALARLQADPSVIAAAQADELQRHFESTAMSDGTALVIDQVRKFVRVLVGPVEELTLLAALGESVAAAAREKLFEDRLAAGTGGGLVRPLRSDVRFVAWQRGRSNAAEAVKRAAESDFEAAVEAEVGRRLRPARQALEAESLRRNLGPLPKEVLEGQLVTAVLPRMPLALGSGVPGGRP